jgi:hypothetical protein
MDHGLPVVLEILVYISMVAEQHTLVEEGLVDREDFRNSRDERQADRTAWVKFRGRSCEDGEGSGRELAHVDSGGDPVVLGADQDVGVGCEATGMLVEVQERERRVVLLRRLIVRSADGARRACDCGAGAVRCGYVVCIGVSELDFPRPGGIRCQQEELFPTIDKVSLANNARTWVIV